LEPIGIKASIWLNARQFVSPLAVTRQSVREDL